MTLTTTMIDTHSVLICKSRGITWQRDLNASKNIFKISKDVITGFSRPPVFLRNQKCKNPSFFFHITISNMVSLSQEI
ncbi:uncharacterized protein RHIMIDRAFT_24708 [Rhizopus microsporus ATCC 52813]|uniref:Uncharacterized protein n=1 Tax=Rhizopus microsporus ATCC 52813 TaxID=1340429 RepID=A0A2G4SRQ6_RHIZD|nr:uncharacterized protein RHIMIDRAFT_24708 [Rhizopus microsporus ATCC 52813]PHZ11467.1 hypothetical protein RHIMIDRAFT_24708 [Rhizopus microsporus ATCC 52813]